MQRLLWLYGRGCLDCNQFMWRPSTPMPLCCFLSFVRLSFRWQALVSTVLAPTYPVNSVSSVIGRWLVLPTCRCPCPSQHAIFPDVLEEKTRLSLCPLTVESFPIKKGLRNPLNRRLLFPVICRRDDARMSSPERRLGQRFIRNRWLPM